MKKERAQTKIGSLFIWIIIILCVFTTFSLLSYFGVFHPKNLMPSTCSFGQDIKCLSYSLYTNGIELTLESRLSSPVMVTNITVHQKERSASCNSSISTSPWIAREQANAVMLCDFSALNLTMGFKHRLDLTIIYYPTQSGPPFGKELSGKLFTTYQNETYDSTVTIEEIK